jgi:S1-C subfamily serine protease
VAAGVAVAIAGCASDDDPASPIDTIEVAPSTTWPPLDREAAQAAALEIRADGCGPRVAIGSGSMIDDDLAVTAAHVVAGAEVVEVTDAAGRSTAAEVVRFDPERDLAVLRTGDPIGSPVAVRSATATAGELGVIVLPRREDGTVVVDVAEVEVIRPVRINTTDIYLDADVTRDGFELAADVDPGDSGGVVVLPGGAVGIVWARSNARENRAWAVDLPVDLVDVLTEPGGRTTPADVGPCLP